MSCEPTWALSKILQKNVDGDSLLLIRVRPFRIFCRPAWLDLYSKHHEGVGWKNCRVSETLDFHWHRCGKVQVQGAVLNHRWGVSCYLQKGTLGLHSPGHLVTLICSPVQPPQVLGLRGISNFTKSQNVISFRNLNFSLICFSSHSNSSLAVLIFFFFFFFFSLCFIYFQTLPQCTVCHPSRYSQSHKSQHCILTLMLFFAFSIHWQSQLVKSSAC